MGLPDRCGIGVLLAVALPAVATSWQVPTTLLKFNPAACSAIPAAEFSKEGRLAAMLSVHAHAYFGAGAPPPTLSSMGMALTNASVLLRCDPDRMALSRRRRAIAKLAAYGWETGAFNQQLLILGLNVERFEIAVLQALPPHVVEAARHNRTILEFLFARLLRGHPELIADAGDDLCDDQPEAPYDPPFKDDSPSQISIETFVSVALPLTDVQRNLDPQRWDECSKFWPAPDTTSMAPLDPHLGSTYLATESSSDCTLSAGEIDPELSAPAPGDTYHGKFFFERFQCLVAPCNAEFDNLLSITVEDGSHDVLGVGVLVTRRIDYGFPACPNNSGTDPFDGGISTRVDGALNAVKVILDEGTMDAWEKQVGNANRTFVRGHKKVKFDNPVLNGSAGVALGFTELNQELAEVACCLKAAP